MGQVFVSSSIVVLVARSFLTGLVDKHNGEAESEWDSTCVTTIIEVAHSHEDKSKGLWVTKVFKALQ